MQQIMNYINPTHDNLGDKVLIYEYAVKMFFKGLKLVGLLNQS